LAELSEPLQLVILLRYFSGIADYAQIAAICGVPLGTVRSRLHEARRTLDLAHLAASWGSANPVAQTLVSETGAVVRTIRS
jgi:RNA polymerase sigma-70 factor (ECF subfamily)